MLLSPPAEVQDALAPLAAGPGGLPRDLCPTDFRVWASPRLGDRRVAVLFHHHLTFILAFSHVHVKHGVVAFGQIPTRLNHLQAGGMQTMGRRNDIDQLLQ